MVNALNSGSVGSSNVSIESRELAALAYSNLTCAPASYGVKV